jgi:hypothetical protein
MIGIKCGDTTKVAEHLSAIETVDYVVLTAGSFDAIVEVVCGSTETSSTYSTRRSARTRSDITKPWFT